MFKNKPIWIILLIISLLLGVIFLVNTMDISPAAKKSEKKLPNEKILEVIK